MPSVPTSIIKEYGLQILSGRKHNVSDQIRADRGEIPAFTQGWFVRQNAEGRGHKNCHRKRGQPIQIPS